jgi:3-oxoacyl-[acyl-carrier-protein] reductase
MLLDGKVALVTGGSRGIGRAIAVALAREGAKLAINFAGNEKAAEETKALVEQAGSEAILLKADVSDKDADAALIDTVIKTYGKIDILVNNAGITRDNLMLRMKEDDFDAVIDTNLRSVFYLTKAAAKSMMKKRTGRIINMSSVVGLTGNAGQVNYAAAKAGVLGITKSAAKELASRGITVNAVAPGFIETDMTDVLSDTVKESLLHEIPLKRMGEPKDVANAVLFLASDQSAYITGQVIHVDGGLVM